MVGTTDVKSLLLEVDASVELLRKNLTRGVQAVGQFETDTKNRLDRIDRRFDQLGSGFKGLTPSITRARTEIASIGATVSRVEDQVRASSGAMRTALLSSTSAIAAALSVNQIKDYADAYTRFTNSLKVAGKEGAALTATQDQLFATAQRNGVQLELLGGLYGGIASLQRDLGASDADTLRLTQAVSAALKVKGGSAESAAGAIIGLNQALGQARVQSDEYNQILDGARPLLQAAADASDKYGGSLAKLKQDIEAGNVSGKDLFRILLGGYDVLEAKAGKANLTVAASFTVLNNAMSQAIGRFGETTGATVAASQAIVAIANNLDTILPALTVIAAAFTAGRVVSAAFVTDFVAGTGAAGASARLFAQEIAAGNVVMIGGKVAAAQRAAAVEAGALAEVAAIEATIAARRADQASLAQTLALIEAQRAAALQAQAAMATNAALGFGTAVGYGRNDAARANQDLKAQITTKRALAAVNAEVAAAETALAAAQTRAQVATNASNAAAKAATLASRAAAAASRLFAGALTLIGGSVAGGAAVLAIGALVGAFLYMRSQSQKAAEQLAAFAEHEREATETSKLFASYALSASAGVAAVGSQSATAAPKVLAFAGAVGEAAEKLRVLAEQRRNELRSRAASDRANASTDYIAAGERFQAAQGTFNAKVGYIGRDEAAMAAALRQRTSAAQRFNNANGILQQTANQPLSTFVRESDRPGGRDVAGDLERIKRDLAIARQGGNRTQIRDLQTQQFEVNQYAKYRKSGLSVEAANAQATKDASDFRSAGEAKQARTDGAKAARTAATAQRQEAAEKRDAAADARAYTAAERQTNNDIAAARAELSGSAEERARIEKARIESERQSKNDEIEDQAKQGRFGTGDTAKARTLELQRLNNERAGLEGQVVDARERQRIADEQLAVAQAGRQNEQDLLRAQSNIATTASERRRIELRLLDLQYDEERARLDGVIASRDTSDAEKKIARERKAALDAIQAVDRKGVEEQNAGPTEQYRQRLRKATGNIHEALDEVTANGLQNLEDGLLGIVTGTESVGSAFKKMAASIIADLARIAIQKAILKAVGTSFLGFADGGEIPGLANGGSVGGVIKGPGTGKSDSILALLTGPDGGAVRVSAGETIMNERASDQFGPLLAAMNAGRLRRFANGGPIGGGSIPSLRVTPAPNLGAIRGGDRGGVVEHRVKVDVAPSPLFDTRVQQHTMAVVQASAPALVEASTANTISQLSRPRLPGGFG